MRMQTEIAIMLVIPSPEDVETRDSVALGVAQNVLELIEDALDGLEYKVQIRTHGVHLTEPVKGYTLGEMLGMGDPDDFDGPGLS